MPRKDFKDEIGQFIFDRGASQYKRLPENTVLRLTARDRAYGAKVSIDTFV